MFAVLLISFLAVVQSGAPTCNSPDTNIQWSELICQHCKCNNIKGRKNGVRVASRDDCETLAIAADQDYYNYMVDGPRDRFCVFSESSVAASESTSSEESCEVTGAGDNNAGSRIFVGGVPTNDQHADKTNGITKSDWKIYRIKYECRDTTACNPNVQLAIAQSKCTGLKDIQFRLNIVRSNSLAECGALAHAGGFGYFSYRTDEKYCYWGEHHSSPYKCEASNIVSTGSDQWNIYTVDCA